jgi:ATP-dependent DNA ligase
MPLRISDPFDHPDWLFEPAHQAVLDGEIACHERDGRSHFYKLLFRRDWPFFCAFDLLSIEGEDLRGRRCSSASAD